MSRLRLHLSHGSHPDSHDGLCAMEAVAWIAGEPHSDEPRCACPVLSAVVRAVNDSVGDNERDRMLLPLVPRLVNSRARSLERSRSHALLDLTVRTLAPMALRARRRDVDAAALERLDPIVDAGGVRSAAAWCRAVAPELKSLNWLLERAKSKDAPHAWIAGVVSVAVIAGDAGLVRLLRGVTDCTGVVVNPTLGRVE